MDFPGPKEKITSVGWAQRMKSFQCRQADLNRLIMQYLIAEGYQDAAKQFEIEAQLKIEVDMNTFDKRLRIRNEIKQGRINLAMNLAKKMYPKIFETDNYMYFHMQQLELIELIREGKIDEALKFAQSKNFGQSGSQKETLFEMERTLGLLAFEKPEESPFGDLMQPKYRHKIANEFNSAVLKMEHAEELEPKLMFLIKLIFWAQSKLDDHNADYKKLNLDVTDIEEDLRRALKDD